MNGAKVEFPGGHGRQDHHQSLAESERSLCESELAGPGCAQPGRLFRSSREIFLFSRRSPWMFEKIFCRSSAMLASLKYYKDPIVKYSTLEIENSEDRQLHEMLGKRRKMKE